MFAISCLPLACLVLHIIFSFFVPFCDTVFFSYYVLFNFYCVLYIFAAFFYYFVFVTDFFCFSMLDLTGQPYIELITYSD